MLLAVVGCASHPGGLSFDAAPPVDRPGQGQGGQAGREDAAKSIRSWEECGSFSVAAAVNKPFPPRVFGLAVSPGSEWLVATTADNAFAWRVEQDFAKSTLAWTFDTGLEIYPEFSSDGALVAISGDGRAVFDIASGQPVLSLAPPPGVIAGCWTAFFGFSRNGEWVAGTGYDYSVQVFTVVTQALVATLPSGSCTSAAAFSPDGGLMATGVPELYRTSDWTRVWPRTVAREPEVDGLSTVDSVSFTPDGERLIVSRCHGDKLGRPDGCQNRLFSVATGGLVEPALPFGGSRPSFSADGLWLLAGGEVYNLATRELRHLGAYSAAAFASNGDIFVGSTDGVVNRLCANR
jgi:hypothetical protein